MFLDNVALWPLLKSAMTNITNAFYYFKTIFSPDLIYVHHYIMCNTAFYEHHYFT
jgi:hypothetical protein